MSIQKPEVFTVKRSVLDAIEHLRGMAWPITSLGQQLANNEMLRMEAKLIQECMSFDRFETIERQTPYGPQLSFAISRYPDYMAILDGGRVDQLFGYLFNTGLTNGCYPPEERAKLAVVVLEHSHGVKFCMGDHKIRPERLPRVVD